MPIQSQRHSSANFCDAATDGYDGRILSGYTGGNRLADRKDVARMLGLEDEAQNVGLKPKWRRLRPKRESEGVNFIVGTSTENFRFENVPLSRKKYNFCLEIACNWCMATHCLEVGSASYSPISIMGSFGVMFFTWELELHLIDNA